MSQGSNTNVESNSSGGSDWVLDREEDQINQLQSFVDADTGDERSAEKYYKSKQTAVYCVMGFFFVPIIYGFLVAISGTQISGYTIPDLIPSFPIFDINIDIIVVVLIEIFLIFLLVVFSVSVAKTGFNDYDYAVVLLNRSAEDYLNEEYDLAMKELSLFNDFVGSGSNNSLISDPKAEHLERYVSGIEDIEQDERHIQQTYLDVVTPLLAEISSSSQYRNKIEELLDNHILEHASGDERTKEVSRIDLAAEVISEFLQGRAKWALFGVAIVMGALVLAEVVSANMSMIIMTALLLIYAIRDQ